MSYFGDDLKCIKHSVKRKRGKELDCDCYTIWILWSKFSWMSETFEIKVVKMDLCPLSVHYCDIKPKQLSVQDPGFRLVVLYLFSIMFLSCNRKMSQIYR